MIRSAKSSILSALKHPFFLQLATPVHRNLALTAAWLIIINLFALLALNRMNLAPDTGYEWMSPEIFKPLKSWNIIDLHNRWDSYWFLDVARNGYYLRGENTQANVVFFPLYPLMVWLLGHLVGGNLVLAGWMVSSIFLLLTVFMFTRLIQEFHPDIDPFFSVVFLLMYPTAFVLNAVYSESLFLFLSFATVFCALRRRFDLACLWAALASATRISGVFLCVFLVVEFIQSNGWRALLTRRVWPLIVAPAGAVLFFLYHWIWFGDFFLYLKVQNWWGRDFDMETTGLIIRNSADLASLAIELFYTAATLLLGLVALRRFRPSYGIYMLVSLGIALGSGTMLGIPRYAMMLFPIYLIGASIRSMVGRGAWLFASALLLALHTIQFVNHYWAG